MLDAPQVPGEPALRWSSRAHSDRRDRARAGPDLEHPQAHRDGVRRRGTPCRGPDERDEPRRRGPPAGDRRARRGDHPAAHRQAPVAHAHPHLGRSREPVLARCPDPGLLRPAPGRCGGDVRRADLHHRRRRGRTASRGDRRAAPHPRPAGDPVVARRAAVRVAAGPRPARDGRPARHRRIELGRRRPRAAARPVDRDGSLQPRRQRLRPGPPEPLARGDRLRLRPARVHPVPHVHQAGRRDLRDARRDAGARGRRTWSSPSTTSPGSPRDSG